MISLPWAYLNIFENSQTRIFRYRIIFTSYRNHLPTQREFQRVVWTCILARRDPHIHTRTRVSARLDLDAHQHPHAHTDTHTSTPGRAYPHTKTWTRIPTCQHPHVHTRTRIPAHRHPHVHTRTRIPAHRPACPHPDARTCTPTCTSTAGCAYPHANTRTSTAGLRTLASTSPWHDEHTHCELADAVATGFCKISDGSSSARYTEQRSQKIHLHRRQCYESVAH
ncbi:hypothetical protein B0H14DRAFT_3426943 [Mycena olivaceomarginata]|nr:hypothetical protein B0H14DRAFT_3426943 [Mycena olivaceomarginata]